ncbi:hypothetical protein MTO96_017049 [Rhipicephalus appendiculatus]
MASRPTALPLKEHCFNFTVPGGEASVDEIIDGLEDVMGSEGVLFLQHLGASKILVAARNASQATKLMVNQGFKIQGTKVQVEAVGAPSVQVSLFRLPPYVPDDAVISALQPYGKSEGNHVRHPATTPVNVHWHPHRPNRDGQAHPQLPFDSRSSGHA